MVPLRLSESNFTSWFPATCQQNYISKVVTHTYGKFGWDEVLFGKDPSLADPTHFLILAFDSVQHLLCMSA